MKQIFIGFIHPSFFNGSTGVFNGKPATEENIFEQFKDASILTMSPRIHEPFARSLGLEGQILMGSVVPSNGDEILFITPLERFTEQTVDEVSYAWSHATFTREET